MDHHVRKKDSLLNFMETSLLLGFHSWSSCVLVEHFRKPYIEQEGRQDRGWVGGLGKTGEARIFLIFICLYS
jgi:hypothetical protein